MSPRPRRPVDLSPAALVRRDALVLAHLDLVTGLAWAYHLRHARKVAVEDLVGAGRLGLLDAAAAFDPTRRVPFPAFAQHRIRGAMRDACRALDLLPRDARRRERALPTGFVGECLLTAEEWRALALTAPSPWEALDAQIRLSQLWARAALAPVHQTILQRVDLDGGWQQDLVDALVLSPSRISQRRSEALDRLRTAERLDHVSAPH